MQCTLQSLVLQLCLQLALGESAYSYKGLAVQHSEHTKEGRVLPYRKEIQKCYVSLPVNEICMILYYEATFSALQVKSLAVT